MVQDYGESETRQAEPVQGWEKMRKEWRKLASPLTDKPHACLRAPRS
uniref:Uncharacterized protein n=1 Tax=Salix viminalis TaxID=40686 RepID=A0A6N2LJW4_SALVM